MKYQCQGQIQNMMIGTSSPYINSSDYWEMQKMGGIAHWL